MPLTHSEKTINNILDYVSSSTSVTLAVVQDFYSATNEALEAARSERLSAKIKLKLARLWLGHREWAQLARTLRELREEGTASDSSDVQSQGTTMLELFALEIQMYRETGNTKKVKVRAHREAS